MKKFILLLLAAVSIFNIATAQRKKGVATVSRYNPKFEFEPENREKVASSNVVIALLQPVFIHKDVDRAGAPWSDFSKSMTNDAEELLLAKGFKMRGPFISRDEMVFNDKKQSDFTLQISIDLSVNQQRSWKTVFQLIGPNTFKVSKGEVTVSPAIVMTAISNFTGEKLWKKNLPLQQKNFTYFGSTQWSETPDSFTDEMQQDNNLYNPMAKLLEEIYKESMTILWNQFDPQEMKMIADEAKKERVNNGGN